MSHGFLPAEWRGPGQEALWGVVPADAALEAAAEAAGREAWPPACGLPDVVHTDGSACDGADPVLARAAWAVVWQDNGKWRRTGRNWLPPCGLPGRTPRPG